MKHLISCLIEDSIAIITMDDGQNNVASPDMIDQLNAALDQAEAEKAVVILTGQAEVFCAGFDLNILRTGLGNTFKMLMGGFWLTHRLLSFPMPVIIACNGHAVALGSFLLMAADYRLGVSGPYKIVANEVQIGLTMPSCGLVLAEARLNPSHRDRAALLSEVFSPDQAIAAGFIDRVVNSESLTSEAKELAETYLTLDAQAHTASKRKMRKPLLKKLKWAIRKDRMGFVVQGLKRLF